MKFSGRVLDANPSTSRSSMGGFSKVEAMRERAGKGNCLSCIFAKLSVLLLALPLKRKSEEEDFTTGRQLLFLGQ